MSSGAVFRALAVRASIALLAFALAADGWALVRAFRAAPLPEPPPSVLATLQSAPREAGPTVGDLGAVVNHDLFAPDRSAPAVPYRMPGEDEPSDPAPDPPKPTLLGTAVATDGRSFATVRLGDGSPTLVHVGDRIGEWTVTRIDRGTITITLTASGEKRAEVAAPRPGR